MLFPTSISNQRRLVLLTALLLFCLVASVFFYCALYRDAVVKADVVKNVFEVIQRPVIRAWDIAFTKDNDSGARIYLRRYRNKFAAQTWTEGPGNPADPNTITQWWQAAAMLHWFFVDPKRYRCSNRVKWGNWATCQDAPYTITPPCLVYSFGINWDFSFDDALGRHGCEVHSFDPSMGEKDHARSANVTFHDLGLGTSNTDRFVPRRDRYVKHSQVWKVRTLKAIRDMLGHSDRVIDVFKMDVESYEWAIAENMRETDQFRDIRQFLVEWHLFPDAPMKEDYVRHYHMYRRLREMGIRKFHSKAHSWTPDYHRFNLQCDMNFVNDNFGKKTI